MVASGQGAPGKEGSPAAVPSSAQNEDGTYNAGSPVNRNTFHDRVRALLKTSTPVEVKAIKSGDIIIAGGGYTEVMKVTGKYRGYNGKGKTTSIKGTALGAHGEEIGTPGESYYPVMSSGVGSGTSHPLTFYKLQPDWYKTLMAPVSKEESAVRHYVWGRGL